MTIFRKCPWIRFFFCLLQPSSKLHCLSSSSSQAGQRDLLPMLPLPGNWSVQVTDLFSISFLAPGLVPTLPSPPLPPFSSPPTVSAFPSSVSCLPSPGCIKTFSLAHPSTFHLHFLQEWVTSTTSIHTQYEPYVCSVLCFSTRSCNHTLFLAFSM